MKKFFLAFLLAVVSFSLFAQPSQDRVKMERERQSLQKELSEIQSVYQQVKGQKKETIGQLNLLQRKMNLQGQYINNINKEIHIISDEIYLSNLEINRLQRQLDTLRTQYARSVVYAYKNRSTYDYLNFIFSASSFNDALKRISYLKSYRTYRQQQVANIVQTQKAIEDKKQQLLGKKTQKSDALQNQTQQLQVLEDQKKEKDEVVAKLKSQEKDLQKQIAARRKRDAQLKGAIAAVIRREIEAARKAAAAKAAAEKAERDRRLAAEKAERDRRAAAEKAERDRIAREKAATNKNNAATANAPVDAPVAAAPTPSAPASAPASRPSAPARSTGSVLASSDKDIALNAGFENNRGRLPWPVDNGYVSIPFGRSKLGGLDFDNPGITIATPSAGAAVKAVFDGEVSSVANLGDGMTVMIRHGKYFTIYSNLSSVTVSKGMNVSRGQVLGRTGTADDGSGGQLDFLLMQETRNVNPEPWLRR